MSNGAPTKISTGDAQAALAKLEELTANDLTRRAIERRAVEAIIWGMPAVNFDRLCQAMLRLPKGGFNQVVYWSRLSDWKNQTLTPNPDSIYLMPFINTKDVGPVVLEIPPADEGSITGSIDDAWQTALEDVGPAGADKGEGGKYLVLPPGYDGDVPRGYFLVPAETNRTYALLRSILRSGNDVAKAVAYGKRVKLYPLTHAAEPPPTIFSDAADVVFDTSIPYDLRFFESLSRTVQAEPWLARDRAMLDPLKSIGIEKGKLFLPDAETQDILDDAAREAHAWLDLRYESAFSSGFYDGRRWALPVSNELVEGMETAFANPDSYPLDGRGIAYAMGFFSAKHLGRGQFYLMAIKDRTGQPLDGAKTYRLNVPPKVPVTQYWSATVYDRATHTLIPDLPRGSRSSQSPDLTINRDGSVDIYFGPAAPSGKDSNWVPTSPGGEFEVLFRFYGPERSFFDKRWVLPDIEKIS
jgi:hypothetical protein